MILKIRVHSGLVMLTFVVGHFINHTLGLISLEALEAGRAIFIAPWRTLVGSVLIVGAVLIHAGIGLSTLFRRRNLDMGTVPDWIGPDWPRLAFWGLSPNGGKVPGLNKGLLL